MIGWGGAAVASGTHGSVHATCSLRSFYFEALIVGDDPEAELSVGFGDAMHSPSLLATRGCVGCGVDANGRPFYTVDGAIVYVHHRRISRSSPAVVSLDRSVPGRVVLLNTGERPWHYAPASTANEQPGDLVAVRAPRRSQQSTKASFE